MRVKNMHKIIQIIDISNSWPWHAHNLYKNEDILNEKGIYFAKSSPWSGEYTPSHIHYYANRLENKNIHHWIKESFEEINTKIKKGQDILFYTWSIMPEGHESFEYLLKNYLYKNEDIKKKVFLILGKQACVFKQRWSEKDKDFSKSTSFALIRRFANISKLIEKIEERYGEDNLEIITDNSESINITRNNRNLEKLFGWLGIKKYIIDENLPRNAYSFKSKYAREIYRSIEVGKNEWPQLNINNFINQLSQIERSWEEDSVCPQKYIDLLNKQSEQDINIICNKFNKNIDDLRYTCQNNRPGNEEFKISEFEQYLDDFIKNIDNEILEVIKKRLMNDKAILTNNQKILLKKIINDESYNIIDSQSGVIEVSVLTVTYNHNRYIEDCIKSVINQKTNFKVRHIIVDHCSTDGTNEIISKYANKYSHIQPVLLSKRIQGLNIWGLLNRCRTKYAALCDGDDYFIDDYKLQKQIDYLEKNTECTICAHPVKIIYEEENNREEIYPQASMLDKGYNAKYDIEVLFKSNILQTNSVVYKWRFTSGLPEWFNNNICPGDWYWHLLHAELGKIGYMSDIMSVYRRHKKAIYNNSNKYPLLHRKKHGLAELATYKTVNEHFKGKYIDKISRLTNGVFENFLRLSKEDDDTTLIDRATELYPEFAKIFLEKLKQINQN